MGKKDLTFVGLDIEATGSGDTNVTAAAVYQICQIGVAFGVDGVFQSDIGWDRYEWQPEALEVNGFTHERIRAGRSAEIVDHALAVWIEARGILPRTLLAVGFNVGGFDLPFVRKYLPKSAGYFSRRSADLNAACFLLGGGNGWTKIKDEAKNVAQAAIGDRHGGTWHEAGYDALAALTVWSALRMKVAGSQAGGVMKDSVLAVLGRV